MESNARRALQVWREEKHLSPEQLAQAGAGITAELIQQWEADGEPPGEALPHLITVARTLNIPLEQLDLGRNRRGFTEAGYSFVIFTRGRDDRRWRARVGAWGWPAGTTPSEEIAERAASGARAIRSTSEAALNALETELRALVRRSAQADEATEPPLAEAPPAQAQPE
jgi:hypothetical protein